MSDLFYLPFRPAFNANGVIESGAQLRFRVSGTVTPASVYTTSALTTAHSNPVVANAAGRWPAIYLDPAVSYRVDILDADGADLDSIDPYIPAGNPEEITAINEAVEAAEEAARVAAAHRFALARLGAATGANDQPARNLLGDEEDGWAFDATTTNADNVFVRSSTAPAKNFEGALAAWKATFGVPPWAGTYSVNDIDGASSTTSAGDVPYSYENGLRGVLVDAAAGFRIPDTHIPVGTEYTVYGVAVRLATGAGGLAEIQGAVGADTHLVYVGVTASSPDTYQAGYLGPAPEGHTTAIGEAELNDVVPFVLRAKEGEHSVSVLGEPDMEMGFDQVGEAYAESSGFTVTEVEFGSSGTWLLLFAVGLNRAVSDEERSAFLSDYSTYWKATVPISRFKETFGTDGGDKFREPNAIVFDDGSISGEAHWLAFADQRHNSGATAEEPRRVVGRFCWATEDGPIRRGPLHTITEPSGWDAATGDYCSAIAGKDSRSGKCVMLFRGVNGVSVASPNTASYPLLMVESSANFREIISGAMTPSTVFLPGGANGSSEYISASPGGMIVQFPYEHPTYPGRQVAALEIVSTTYGSGIFLCYRDPTGWGTFGSWTMGAAMTGGLGGDTLNEPHAVIRPDGVISVFVRTRRGSTENLLTIAESSDGGATLARVDTLEAADGLEMDYGPFRATQLDPTGRYGGLGLIALIRPLDVSGGSLTQSRGAKVSYFRDTTYALHDEFMLMREGRQVRGLTLDPLFSGRRWLVTGEHSQESDQNKGSTAFMGVVEPPVLATF